MNPQRKPILPGERAKEGVGPTGLDFTQGGPIHVLTATAIECRAFGAPGNGS
jgi:hypothetical protein